MTEIILADVSSLLFEAYLFKKSISFLTFTILFLNFLFLFDEIINDAPLLRAFSINKFPSFFLPLIVKKRLFFTVLESIERP